MAQRSPVMGRAVILIRPLLNAAELAAWARAEGFRDLLPSGWHVTIINAHRPPAAADLVDAAGDVVVAGGDRSVLRLGPFIALMFWSDALTSRHRLLRNSGVDSERVRYRPHVTFSVEGSPDLSTVTPYEGELRFGAEVWE